MLENFYFAIFTAVFFIGVISVLYVVLMRVIRPRGGETNFVVVVCGPDEKNAVARIGYLLTRVCAAGDKPFTRIIAVDNGMSEAQYEAILSAFGQESRVQICPRASFEKMIFG